MSVDNSVLEEFRKLFEGVDNEEVRQAVLYVESCYDPNTPSHNISRIGAMTSIMNLHTYFPDRNAFFKKAEPLIERVMEHLADLGYREDISTYQEHKLVGSTQWREYSKNPHKPIGVMKGDLTVEEANRARGLERFQGALRYYFGIEEDIDKFLVNISLEPLDADGNTVRDPRVLDDRLEPVPTSYIPDFPYRRENLQ